MNTQDMQSFFADEETIDRDVSVIFTYFIETLTSVKEAAASLCQETSTAQWKRPNVDEDFRPRHAAKVISLEPIDEGAASVFSSTAVFGSRFSRARVRIAHPIENFGARLPNLLTVAMGEGAFFSHGITSIKLIDIEFPDSFLAAFQGPQFGTAGLRRIIDVFDRPLFFGVVKPNVGLDPAGFAELAREAWVGGLDVAKDDEMLADTAYSPFAQRMQLVGQARQEAEQITGRPKIFIANITDEVDRIIELHDIAVENGVNAVMLNVMAVGLSAVRMLRKRSQVPIIAHFDCIAPMSRHPYFGVSTTVLTKLQRLAGCDAIIMPGFGERMMTSEEEVLANVQECVAPMGSIASVLPVPGGSDWAGTLPQVYERLRTIDFALVPGRGVFGHPQGPRAGAESLVQSWEATVARIDLAEYAEQAPQLRAAIEAFSAAGGQDDTTDGEALIHGYTGAVLSSVMRH